MANNLSKIRKEELSFFHYIKDKVLPCSNFIEHEEKIPLDFNEELSSSNNDDDPTTNSYVYELGVNMEPAPYDLGRGWLYFDVISGTNLCTPYPIISGTRIDGVAILGTPEQSNRITVYDPQLNEISDDQYMIDYSDCRIVTSGTCNPAYINYVWNYVSLIDDWESASKINPPVVVIDFVPSIKGAYQLGGGKKVVRDVNIFIFASSAIEKNELVDSLYDGLYLKSVPIYEFPLGDILDYDGTWYGRKKTHNKLTSLFDRTTSSFSIGNMFFSDVVVRDIKADIINRAENIFLSDINKYRAKIELKAVYYT